MGGLLGMWLLSSRQSYIDGCIIFSEYGWNSPESKEVLMRMGAVDAAMRAVQKYPDDKEVVSGCLNSVAALSLYNRAVSLYAADLGVVETTALVWRKWSDDVTFVMANYFGCYQDFAPENRERMRKAGAIELALEAGHPKSPHYWDASAQFRIWCGFSSFHSYANHWEFRRLGGLPILVTTYRDHARSYRVREEILQATKGLCAYRVMREELAELGFVPLLVSSLIEAKGDPQVQALALETLRTFVDKNATLRSEVVGAGGVEIAMAALRTHAAKLLNTRDTSWDSQNVYGELNDNQYNVPGAATEVLFSLAHDGAATRKAMLEVGVVAQLQAAVQATQQRIATVKQRTHGGACATLAMLRAEAAEEGTSEGLERAFRASFCPPQPPPPIVYLNDAQFEP